jgi:hypothetical protein
MTIRTCVARGGGSPWLSARAAIALVALAGAPTWALADTQVRGKPNAVTVEAKNASVEEVLVALANTFKVQFRSSANLEKRLTGTYTGTLQQVVSHVLRGYDFVAKSGEKGIEITLLGSGKPIAIGAAPSAPAPVEQRADTEAEPSPPTDAADRPLPTAASTGPLPVIKIAEGGPPIPTAARPTSGMPPMPVAATGTGAVPAPSPPEPGSKPGPIPLPSKAATLLPPPVPGAVSPATPSPAQ